MKKLKFVVRTLVLNLWEGVEGVEGEEGVENNS
jgi:hypothetical protein